MAEATERPNPFDVQTIRRLVELMARYDLNEIDLNQGETRIRLRRGARATGSSQTGTHGATTPAPAPTEQPPAPTVVPGSVSPPATQPSAPPTTKLIPITSELIGTFYAKPRPDKEPFVKVGSQVKPDTVVCLIEAMKVYNEVVAGVTGTIAEVCVDNGQYVEYGTVLFKVIPS